MLVLAFGGGGAWSRGCAVKATVDSATLVGSFGSYGSGGGGQCVSVSFFMIAIQRELSIYVDNNEELGGLGGCERGIFEADCTGSRVKVRVRTDVINHSLARRVDSQ